MKYYRKQPVEAIQWNGDNQKELSGFIDKVAKNYCTKDDGYGNLYVCYTDSKNRKHVSVLPKFGWIVVEGKTLQFYTDDTFNDTFVAVAESASEALWPDTQELVDKFDKAFDDCMFKGFHGIPKEKIQDMFNMEARAANIRSREQSLYDFLQRDHASHKEAKDTFDSVLDEMKELHAKKNKDYKGSFHDLFKEYGMPYALGHLEEKLNRVKAITANGGNAVKNDHIEDSVIDLASYAVMLYVELKNQKK